MHDGAFVYVSYHGAGGRPNELERGRQREWRFDSLLWYTLRFVVWLACSSFQTTRVSSCPLCYRPIASNFYWPGQGRSLAPPTITTPLAIGWALAWQLITVHFGFSAACALHTSVHANTRMCGQLVCVSILYTLWKVVWPKPDQPDHLLWPCVMIVHVHTIYVYMYILPHLSSHRMVSLHW